MATQRFKTIVAKTGSRTAIPIPFDPNAVWGVKQRHHITGTINGCAVRGSLGSDGQQYARFLETDTGWPLAQCERTDPPAPVGPPDDIEEF